MINVGIVMMMKTALRILRRRGAPATTLMIRDVTEEEDRVEQDAAQDDGPQEYVVVSSLLVLCSYR
jgi:hypothetical protein